MTDEEAEPIPPSADRVARRALALAAVVCRSGIEGDSGKAEAEKFREGVIKWVEEVGLTDEIEPERDGSPSYAAGETS